MFTQWYADQRDTSIEWLQDIHRNPEVGFEEVRTSAFIAERLREFGYDVVTGIGSV